MSVNAVTFAPSEVMVDHTPPLSRDLWTKNPNSFGLEFVSVHERLMLDEEAAVAVSPVTVTSCWSRVFTVIATGVESKADEVPLALIE